MEQIPPPEFREKIAEKQSPKVEANTYKTRRIVCVQIEGRDRFFHSVKGGFEDEIEKKTTGAVYEILFDPITNEWLKITTPKTNGSESKNLDKSADIMKASLELAGFDDLADQIVKCKVKIRGKETNGFVSPHIGPSLETMIRMYRDAKRTMDPERYSKFGIEAKAFFSNAYASALNHSVQLYLKHGYWTQDPNPGNILFRVNEQTGELKPITIDFTGKHQTRQPGVFEYLGQLQANFNNQAAKHGIRFDLNLEEYRRICQTERPGRPISERRIFQAPKNP